MTRVSPREPMGQKEPKLTAAEKRAAKAHMGRVAQLPCVICGRWPVKVHHVIHGRYSTRRPSGFKTIPLCPPHHDHGYPDAIHSGKESWAERYGYDYDYLPVVADMLAGEWNA